MVIWVVGNTDALKYEELGSNCCWAKLVDPGNVGEGLCSECGEHATRHYIQEVDIAVIDTMDADHRVHIYRLEYDNCSTEYEDLDDCIQMFLYERYGNTNSLERVADEVNPIKVLDHRIKTWK